MGMQLLFESTTELGGAEGIGLLEGPVEQLDAPKIPQIGWNAVSWRRASVLNEGLPDPCAFYHANSFAPRPARAEDVLGTAEYGSEFVSVVERPPVYGLQSHPEKSGPDGLRLLRELRAPGGGAHDPAAGGGHPRRQGRAAAPGRTSTTRPSTPTTRSRRRARSWRPARASCTSSTSTARARASRSTCTTSSGSRASWRCRSSSAAGCARSPRSGARSRPGAARVVLGTAAFTDPDLLDEALTAFTSRVLVGVDVRGGKVSVSGLDARDPDARRGRDPAACSSAA